MAWWEYATCEDAAARKEEIGSDCEILQSGICRAPSCWYRENKVASGRDRRELFENGKDKTFTKDGVEGGIITMKKSLAIDLWVAPTISNAFKIHDRRIWGFCREKKKIQSESTQIFYNRYLINASVSCIMQNALPNVKSEKKEKRCNTWRKGEYKLRKCQDQGRSTS